MVGVTPNPYRKPPSFLKLLVADFSEKLLIPPRFARVYADTLGAKCILRPTHTHIPWTVTTTKVDNHVYFEEGWKEFAKHHSLEFYFVLLFQYDTRVSEFDVVIFDKSSCSWDPLLLSPNVECLLPDQLKVDQEIAADEVMMASKFPAFKRVIKSAYARSGGYLPIKPDFAEKYWKNSIRNVKIELSDKSWTVKFSGENYRRAAFSSGWSALVKDNSLQVNDVCLFQLIDTKSDTLKLSIFRRTSGVDRRPHVKRRPSSTRFTAASTEPSGKALEKAKKFGSRSKYLSHVVVMHRSYVQNAYLHLSKKILKKIGMKVGENKVKLQRLGKEWDVIIKFTNRISRLYTGWAAFVKDNSLQTGDVCVLELITGRKGVIRVSIFK